MKKQDITPFFRELVSGHRRGLGAALLRGGLHLAEVPYAIAMSWRNRRYDQGKALIHKVSVPVVSVGNITLGGTGKTPLVEWIARWFRAHGVRVSILSRGYRAEEGGRNDEARELEQKLPDVPHVQDPDRVAGARMAIEELETQLILLDDAFQHRRLARDLDIVLIDALEPFGFEHVFPRGTLREPLIGLRRADIVILSRADVLDPPQRDAIRCRVQGFAPQSAWAEVRHAAIELISAGGRQATLDSLKDVPVAAFCGLGNPAGFRHTIQSCGYNLLDFREFPDHHCYSRADIEALADWAGRLGATAGDCPDFPGTVPIFASAKMGLSPLANENRSVPFNGTAPAALLCTHKDLVKIGLDQLGGLPLWAIRVGMNFIAGQDALESRLLALLARVEIENPISHQESSEGTVIE
jgi:tetraacyldisaccharide 4'-kinase